MPRHPLHLIAAILLFLSTTAYAGSAPDETALPGAVPVRQEFISAMQRVRLRLPEPADSAQLESFVLHDYLLAARLRRDLATSPSEALDSSVDAFLQAHGTQPVTRLLRHAWLVNLAQRRRWELYLSRSEDVSDPQLSCLRFQGRIQANETQGLAAAVLLRWSVLQRLPGECDSVMIWLRSQGAITAAAAETQTRAALAKDDFRLARDYAVDVTPARATPLQQWIKLLEAPKAALTSLANHPEEPVEADALAGSYTRLAYTDSATTAALLPVLLRRADMTTALKGRLLRAAAMAAAYERSPAAVRTFDDVPIEALDALALEWRVRTALWAGDFGKVRTWTEQLPPTMAALPRWKYWHARAVEAIDGTAAATPLYSDIAALRDYYGYLAADRLQQPYQMNIKASAQDLAMQASLESEVGMVRAHALFDCELVDDAVSEWSNVLAGAKPAIKLQAAILASGWGWYAQTIATLAQIGEWDDVPLRYPRPYATAIADAAKLANVPPDWILSVMRQESLFRKDAVSRADARGLMQIQPATAVAVARRWHLPRPQPDSLYDPAISVPLGAAYLREMLDRYSDQLSLTLAAYNAGPVSVARWLPTGEVDADIWVECIPYNETRSYVQRIMEHIVAFAVVRGAEPPRLAALMPRLSAAQAGGATGLH